MKTTAELVIALQLVAIVRGRICASRLRPTTTEAGHDRVLAKRTLEGATFTEPLKALEAVTELGKLRPQDHTVDTVVEALSKLVPEDMVFVMKALRRADSVKAATLD
ncbi:uncharacterized protein PFL1_01495 [Pseudozyma flocculosa PF-1]|uniref:Uncharacterized protein n=1 Tax=Pseudozyma flocculosa TaxID=84751 RepID=A0A5C3FBE2_9BASI|nr:uncharacterized protein PFL1_01495 [Pseudozyma flocculosa PF-1]EPQ31310.1 hypothetical protein PFL1_01495 [Pseudozyma flocculosa PF-1]SPO41774.1 uncharacterized protein PSFLO_07256 [Pseudozyma flocculosa]